jgi:hypothetical protein
VDTAQLEDRPGWAITLTVRDCPPTSDDWNRIRDRLLQACRDLPGVELVSWLVEWQRRGVPHLHLAVYGPIQDTSESESEPPITCTDSDAGALVVGAWLRIAREFGPGHRGQDAKRIDGAQGWLQYLSKHAARGVWHYQRQGMPVGWETTGRMWGKVGGWPLVCEERADITNRQMWAYRRLVRRYLLSNAATLARQYEREGKKQKAAEVWDRVAFLRRMLKNPDRGESAFRGMSGWVPLAASTGMLTCVGWDGTLREEAA